MIFKLALLLIFMSEMCFGQATAKLDSLILAADSMTRDLKAQKVYLNGRVLLIFQGQNVRADSAVIDTKNKTVAAEGNLSLVGPQTRAVGSKAEFNYEENTGVIYDALIEKGSQIQLRGKIIRKTGEEDYEIESGEFTACTTCPPAWSFSGSTIKATVGRYAYMSNTVMYLGSVPVFYLPYMIVPIGTKRQTGFLFPDVGYGLNSGTIVSLPFFWAMSDSTDSTWTLQNYQNRGNKGNFNYRYRLSPTSVGYFNTTYIADSYVGNEFRELGQAVPDTERVARSSIKYLHYYELPEGFVHRTDINWASDRLYARDFTNDVVGYGDPAMVSRMSLTKNTDNQHISTEIAHHRNLMATDPRGADDLSIHRYPSVTYNITPQQFAGNFLFDVDARYTNFARNHASFDKLQATGGTRNSPIQIDPDPSDPSFYDSRTDLIRTGHRLIVEPRISHPFNLGPYIDIDPSISFRETDYEFGVGDDPSAYRRYFRGTISARTLFGGVFGNRDDPKAIRYKHEVQPEIVYTTIPWIDDSKHAFFGSSDPFYKREQAIGNSDVPQFDDFDRLYDRHITSFILTNYLIRRDPMGEGSTYSQLVTFKLTQPYDNYEATRSLRLGEAREPWAPLVGTLDLRFPFLDSNTTARYYHYDKVASISSRVRVVSKYGNYLQLTYSQDAQIKKTAIQDPLTNVTNTVSEVSGFSESLNTVAGYRAKYAGIAGYLTYNLLTRMWTDYGYTLDLTPPGDCWYIRLQANFPAQGESRYSFNFGFNYGG